MAVVRALGTPVLKAAAKDLRVDTEHAALCGVIHNRFRRLTPDEDRVNLGGDEWANTWPEDSAWDFVALGEGTTWRS